MVSAKGVKAGDAFVRIGYDSGPLNRGLRRAQARLKAFGAGVKTIGRNLISTSVAMSVPIAVGAIAFGRFEQRMARVKALAEANAQDFQRLTEKARELGETTVYSASQAAEAMGFFAQAGYDADKILSAIGPTLNMAAAGQMEVAEAADIAVKAMASLGYETDEYGYVIDVMTRAMTSANTNLPQLGDAFKYVGSIAKNSGAQIEEIIGAIQLLSNAGIQAEMAGTTLRGALLSLTNPSAEATQTLDKLEVTILDAQDNIRPLAAILGELDAAMSGMGGGKRLGLIGKIFPNRQASGIAELVAQGSGRLREFTAALEAAGGTADRVANTQLNTLQGDATILKSALEGLGISIGEAVQGPLRLMARGITKVVSTTSKWIKDNRELVVMVAAAALGIGAAGFAMVGLGVAAQAAGFVLGGLASILAAAKMVLVGIGAVFAAMVSPIGLVVTAIVGFGVAVAAYTGAAGKAVAWFADQFGQLRAIVGDVVQGVTDAFAAGDPQLAAEVMWAGIKVVWQKGVAALKTIWFETKRFFVDLSYRMWYGALSAAQEVWHALEVGWIETTSFLSKTWIRFVDSIKHVWGAVQNFLTHGWLSMAAGIGLITEEQANAAKQMADEEFIANTDKNAKTTAGQLADAENRRRTAREQSRSVHEATMAGIGSEYEAAKDRLAAETSSNVAAAQAELAKAQKDLSDAIEKATKQRKEVENSTTGGDNDFKDIVARLKDSVAGVGAASSKMTSVGTFNAAALFGMGGSSAMERTATAAEQTADNTRRIADQQRRGGTFV